MRFKTLATLLLVSMLASAQADESHWKSQRGLFHVSYQSALSPLQINKLHAWTLHIENADGSALLGAQLEVSGGMPTHDHGLPTQPRVTEELGDGDYRLDGLRFHMTGAWEITINIDADGKSDTVVINVNL